MLKKINNFFNSLIVKNVRVYANNNQMFLINLVKIF